MQIHMYMYKIFRMQSDIGGILPVCHHNRCSIFNLKRLEMRGVKKCPSTTNRHSKYCNIGNRTSSIMPYPHSSSE